MIPDDIVVFAQPDTFVYCYPEWARYAVVTLRGSDGGAASDGTPGGPGSTVTFLVRITKSAVPINIGPPGRDWDGVTRAQGGYVMIELYRERPNV